MAKFPKEKKNQQVAIQNLFLRGAKPSPSPLRLSEPLYFQYLWKGGTWSEELVLSSHKQESNACCRKDQEIQQDYSA